MSLDISLVDPTATYIVNPLYEGNITHNLAVMATEVGIYKAIWQPKEIDANRAKDIINIVEKGLEDLKEHPEHFKQFDAANGWGVYDDFVPFVEKYLSALKEYPEAKIVVFR